MPVLWDESLAVGVEMIDAQHQELFRCVNALLDAMLQARGEDEVAKLLAFLTDYVVKHFGAEQALMTRQAYPGFASHKAEHNAFVKTLLEAQRDFEAKGASAALAIRLNAFLGAWLREHVGTTDRALGKYLSRRKPAITRAARH